MCCCVIQRFVECQLKGHFTAHCFPIEPAEELQYLSTALTSQSAALIDMTVCVCVCVSAEDKPGEIGIIVALAMLILGTFQWAVITSITVDGLVRASHIQICRVCTTATPDLY